jgi:carbonic anhydrase/acetyltransferase-like protein (isoleucine patch superfamily)
VHLEGCTVEDRALVGNGAVVLHRAVVSSGSLVGSNAVVPGGVVVPPGAMALGVPAKMREGVVDPEAIVQPMLSYVARAERYREQLRRID